MAPSDFAKANVEEVVEQLTTDEAILLTAGVGFWHTHGVPRLGVPALKVSDGPNGACLLHRITLKYSRTHQVSAETISS